MTKTAAIAFAICAFAGTGLRQTLAFDYFEHRYLGNLAYQNAVADYEDSPFLIAINEATWQHLGFGVVPANPQNLFDRSLKELPVQFGDLSALAGDLTTDVKDLKDVLRDIAGTPRDLLHEIYDFVTREEERALALIIETRRQWISACKWIYRARNGSPSNHLNWEECFALLAGRAGFAANPKAKFGSQGYRASREELAGQEGIAKYVSLAAQNKDHFPRHSWKAYSDHHMRALDLANCYRKGIRCPNSSLSGDDLLVEAILNEGFAQHYLQDSFAAGHIGSKYGTCGFNVKSFHIPTWIFFCIPTKGRTQQTHDSLNELGLDVTIEDLPPYLEQPGEQLNAKLRSGWTAFGDGHLLTREADFHRAVILHVATQSIREVLERAREGGGQAQPPCVMCEAKLFPIPHDPKFLSEDWPSVRGMPLIDKEYPVGSLVKFEPVLEPLSTEERSLDPRVPGIPVEGWKLGLGFARRGLRAEGAANASGAARTDSGLLIRLDYVRNVEPLTPNSWGFEYWNVANLGTSYLLSAGYSRPRELSPLTWAVRAKLGWRVDENLTPVNPTADRRNRAELIFPSGELVYEMYKPFAVFYQTNAQLRDIHGHFKFKKSGYKGGAAVGLRIDLSGI